MGNPPYVRQESLEQAEKARMKSLCGARWPGLRLTGRADLHCYFWPAAARFLRPAGYFGFLTSSSWLDVEYGFPLQGWMLEHFRVLAVMESEAEPWFEDARVKTCVTILQRCESPGERRENPVHFVCFRKPLSEVVGASNRGDDVSRQRTFDELRRRILARSEDTRDGNLRIVVKKQGELWADGVRSGSVVERTNTRGAAMLRDSSLAGNAGGSVVGTTDSGPAGGVYAAGKWGRYLRAPDVYFDVMSRLGRKFVRLGEIAAVRRGVTSGCDAFFMPRDVSAEVLEAHTNARVFRERVGVARRAVESGDVRVVQAGDGSRHPIEAEFVRPEVHSLMAVERPTVRIGDVDRLMLFASREDERRRTGNRWLRRYLAYGRSATFSVGKSGGRPVPLRSTCSSREPWYDLTRLVATGFAFWPKSQQYRHIVPANPEGMVCNCNLYSITAEELRPTEQRALVAVLNSTLVGLFKTFYGRYAGTEGNLKTEVVDVNLMEVPDPRRGNAEVVGRLQDAFDRLAERRAGRLVEQQLMECHDPASARRLADGRLVMADELARPDRRALDDAVFEMMGIDGSSERAALLGRLYEATSAHFRKIRVVEIEKARQRRGGAAAGLKPEELAEDIWKVTKMKSEVGLVGWVTASAGSDTWVQIPEERPVVLRESPLFPDHTVYFGRDNEAAVRCSTSEQAELVHRLAELGVVGKVRVPRGKLARVLRKGVDARLAEAMARIQEWVEGRTTSPSVQREVLDLLRLWYIRGKE